MSPLAVPCGYATTYGTYGTYSTYVPYVRRCVHLPRPVSHRASAGPGRLVVLGSQSQSRTTRRKGPKAKKRRPKSGTKAATVQMPRSRDDAVSQAALSLRVHYRNALASAPKRKGISEELDVAEGGEVVASYCICPTNSSELALSQDIAAAMLGPGSGSCVFVTEREAGAENTVAYADAAARDADCYVCVAPSLKDVAKLEALLRQLKGARRRTCPFLVVVNPEWCGDLGGAGWDECSVRETAYCFFPILIKPLMMQTLEGVVYKATAGADDEKPWKVWAGNEQVGQMAARPSTGDVEDILYNAVAAKNKNKKDGKGAGPFSKLFG